MKKRSTIAIIALFVSLISPNSFAKGPTEFGSCSKFEQKVSINGKPFHCIKTARGNFVYVPTSIPNGSAIDQGKALDLQADKVVEPLVAKAFNSFDHKACLGSHSNFTPTYLPSPNYPADKLAKQKQLFDQAMSCYNNYFDRNIKINIALASENDYDYMASLLLNGKAMFDADQLSWTKWMMQRIAKGGFSGSAGWNKDTDSAWVIMLDSSMSSTPDAHGAGHEFVHILQSYSKSKIDVTYGNMSTSTTYVNLPPWFWEGTAELFSSAVLAPTPNVFSSVMSVARSEAKGIPSMNKINNVTDMTNTLKKLEAPSDQDSNMMFYALGKQLCEYILATYGYVNYQQIMKNAGSYPDFNENLKSVIGLNKDELYSKAGPWLVNHWKLAKF